jgi:LysR family hydrogen peroxide-inducible transcriptional activator
MELSQITYFIRLAETLNFTVAAKLSGVSQPSLTRAILRLEHELGGPLIYRKGRNTRLTGLGQHVELEFRRMLVALENVRHHSDNWARGKHQVLDVAVAPTVGANAFTAFFLSALEQVPSIEFKLHSLDSRDDVAGVLSGKYHACIFPQHSRPDSNLEVVPLFRERYVLGCATDHPLAALDTVRLEDLVEYPFIDRLSCEYRIQILDHFTRREVVMRPRFRTDREDWVQHVVAQGRAVCVLPERSVGAPGLVTRRIEGLTLERALVMAVVSDSAAPVELRQIAEFASTYKWQ